MKRRVTILALTTTALVVFVGMVSTFGSPVRAGGATRIGGIGYFAGMEQCPDPEGDSPDIAILMTGTLEGCLYVFFESGKCPTGGTYRETGSELFVGTYRGESGTFETTYVFTAKYESCSELAGEIFGRCQHPIVRDSGTGVFEGVTGRFDIKSRFHPLEIL